METYKLQLPVTIDEIYVTEDKIMTRSTTDSVYLAECNNVIVSVQLPKSSIFPQTQAPDVRRFQNTKSART